MVKSRVQSAEQREKCSSASAAEAEEARTECQQHGDGLLSPGLISGAE